MKRIMKEYTLGLKIKVSMMDGQINLIQEI